MATNTASTTKYFWLVTFQWPVVNGIKTATVANTFEARGPISRAETFAQIRKGVRQHGIPEDADVLFLTIEPDQIA